MISCTIDSQKRFEIGTARVYRDENLADVVQITAPRRYGNWDLANFTASLNMFFNRTVSDVVQMAAAVGEDTIVYNLPLTNAVTAHPGNWRAWVSWVCGDTVIKSGMAIMYISGLKDAEGSLSVHDLTAIEQMQNVVRSLQDAADDGEFDGATPYIGENGNWFIGDTDTEVPASQSEMTGATSTAAGASGLVPAPAAGDQAMVLSGAGTWVAQPVGGEEDGWTLITNFTASQDIASLAVSADDNGSAFAYKELLIFFDQTPVNAGAPNTARSTLWIYLNDIETTDNRFGSEGVLSGTSQLGYSSVERFTHYGDKIVQQHAITDFAANAMTNARPRNASVDNATAIFGASITKVRMQAAASGRRIVAGQTLRIYGR